jgi:hypothetical protein
MTICWQLRIAEGNDGLHVGDDTYHWCVGHQDGRIRVRLHMRVNIPHVIVPSLTSETAAAEVASSISMTVTIDTMQLEVYRMTTTFARVL